MFDHQGHTVVHAIHYLTFGIFEHLNITAKTYMDQRVKYTECILTGPALNKYRSILLVCNEAENTYARYHCMLGVEMDVSMEVFGT